MSAGAKRLKDIRYFETADVPGPNASPFDAGHLDVPKSAQRLGQRIACCLEAENLSVGTYDHLYIALTPSLPEGEVALTDFGFESWNRYAAYGTPLDFASRSEAEKLKHIETGTFQILHSLRPDQAPLIERVRLRLAKQGSRARVLRAAKETKAYRFEVWFDVPDMTEKAYLYVLAQDRSSGRTIEAPPIPLADFEDVFPLVSTLTLSNGALNIHPRKSSRANLSVSRYDSPIRISLSKFSAVK